MDRVARRDGTPGDPCLLRLQLEIGASTVEVAVGPDGLRFHDPDLAGTDGVLHWDEAIALAMLPERVRLGRERSAA